VTGVPAKAPVLELADAHTPDEEFTEVWTTGQPVTVEQRDDVVCGHDGEYAFCAAHVPAAARYAEPVRDAYLRVLGTLADLGYRRVFRMWNTIAGLTEANADGLEVYQDFCLGRAEAYDLVPTPPEGLPAATGVGSLGEGITFYLLASRTTEHQAIENVRQLPAYRYPPRYGPRPPAFARAAVLPTEGVLFVSGTGSILGHETVHAGDIDAQCRTVLANVATVTAEAVPDAAVPLATLRNVKVYVRHREHLERVRRHCDEVFAADADVHYVVTELCRPDLLLEVEAIGVAAKAS